MGGSRFVDEEGLVSIGSDLCGVDDSFERISNGDILPCVEETLGLGDSSDTAGDIFWYEE